MTDSLDAAESAISEVDDVGLDVALKDATSMENCALHDAKSWARLWLARAGAAELAGDREAVGDALSGAANAEPTLFLDALGDELQRMHRERTIGDPSARLSIRDFAPGMKVLVDGRPASQPVRITPGTHVLQVGSGDAVFTRTIRAQTGDVIDVQTGLEAPVPTEPVPPPPVKRPKTPSSRGPIQVYAGVGIGASRGSGFDREPTWPIGPRADLGVVLRGSTIWARATLGADILVGGAYTFSTASDSGTRRMPLAPGLFGAVGVTLGALELGVQAGVQLPGRLPVRAVGSLELTGPLRVEARIGAGLVTQPSDQKPIGVSPGGALLLVVQR